MDDKKTAVQPAAESTEKPAEPAESGCEDMKQEMIEIAQLMAKQAVSAQMNVKVSEALVNETLSQIGDSTWQS